MFKDAAALAAVYPALTDHAIKQFSCHDVLRFLSRRTSPGRFCGEASASYLERAEGVRVKHWAEENSIKMYDKQGSVLRIETTINDAHDLSVYRDSWVSDLDTQSSILGTSTASALMTGDRTVANQNVNAVQARHHKVEREERGVSAAARDVIAEVVIPLGREQTF